MGEGGVKDIPDFPHVCRVEAGASACVFLAQDKVNAYVRTCYILVDLYLNASNRTSVKVGITRVLLA